MPIPERSAGREKTLNAASLPDRRSINVEPPFEDKAVFGHSALRSPRGSTLQLDPITYGLD